MTRYIHFYCLLIMFLLKHIMFVTLIEVKFQQDDVVISVQDDGSGQGFFFCALRFVLA